MPTTPSLVLSKAGPEDEPLLVNLFQYYLHDMAEWFGIDPGPDGRYEYDVASVMKDGCDAYLARAGDSIAGFALIGSAPDWISDPGAHDVREFFVIRRFRRSGLGRRMAVLLWNERPGPWLVRVLEANAPALLFWRSAIADFARGSYHEQHAMGGGRAWRLFRFESPGSAPEANAGSAEPKPADGLDQH